MSDYSAQHRSSLATLKRKGTAVTFTPTGGSVAWGTGAMTASTADAVSGYAIASKGDKQTYATLNLVESENPTLFFVPITFGQKPAMASAVEWDGDTYAVKNVGKVGPNGPMIGAHIVVGR